MIVETKPRSATIIDFPGFRVDLGLRRIYRGGELLKLTPKPFNAMEFLLANRHRVVSKEELLEKVWGGVRGISTVEQAVSNLRRTLGDNAAEARFIRTVPGQGYHWIAEVRDAETKTKVERSPSLPVRRVPSAAVAGAALLVVLVGVVLVARQHFRQPVHIARVAINGDTLVAMSGTGENLWKYIFDRPLRVPTSPEETWRSQIVDLNGDGNTEILIAAEYAAAQPSGEPEELFCFSPGGKVLWRYRPKIQMKFNASQDLNGPWRFSPVLVVPGNHASSIWIAVRHAIWWPSFLVKLSPSGTTSLRFVSSGAIYALAAVKNRSGNYILAAGVNNEYRAAALAVIAENGPAATSPQTADSEYNCTRGCPGGRPYRYILLPRSELNSVSGRPYNWAENVFKRAQGVTVQTSEVGGEMLGGGINAFYGFSPEFEPKSIGYGDSYPELHNKAEALGLIKHSFDYCPERNAPAVLKIADENGKWGRVLVPRTE